MNFKKEKYDVTCNEIVLKYLLHGKHIFKSCKSFLMYDKNIYLYVYVFAYVHAYTGELNARNKY